MGAEANKFLLDIAAVDQKRRFLNDALFFGLGAHKFLNARRKAFRIAAKDGMPVLLDALTGIKEFLHPFAKLMVNATAFFLAHPVEIGEHLINMSKYCGFEFTFVQVVVAAHGAG